MSSSNYKFASVAFANAVLWTHRMHEICPEAEISVATPARLTAMLTSGSVDAALIPVVDLFANPELKMVDNIGLSADGNVTSVLLKCCRPLESIRTAACDRNSRTSNILAQILLRHHFHLDVTMVPDNTDKPDARVVIGDRALCSEVAPYGDYDLAGEWKLMTGLPFVFAVWACRKDCTYADKMAQVLQRTLKKGFEHIDEAAELQARRLGIKKEQCRNYIGSVMGYTFGQDELKSMQLLKEMINSGELIDECL